jgi:quercetin dioxygenase-like cupin family protein
MSRPDEPALWFLGTLVRMKLTGEDTDGRFALWEGTLPHGAAPPLHSHPQDETFYVLEGEMRVWLGDADGEGRRCRAGDVVFAPSGMPHAFLVESDTARVLTISTPAGIEDMVLGLAEEATWPWLQPPPDGPRVAPERLEAVWRETGMVIHGPRPTVDEFPARERSIGA